ncbi:DUF4384 domain-containing protein [Marivita sp. S6314]|uniref:DUF4384 domain-containing protein n=1 Tax=Marivita sp. S6314 TaxID=2926406 RepID=UPI001FF66D3F|nr:DUF4384 domain-containing protein [Marivita sp. S6314]MCK0149304.1 DUF4384 domain-containing protein [Marivita sp. S6314]
MKTSPLIWAASGAASIGLHVAAAGVLIWAIDPDDVPVQPTPQTELQLSTYQVERSQAEEATPDGQSVQNSDLETAPAGQSSIPTSRVTPLDAPAADLSAVDTPTENAAAQTLAGAAIQPEQPDLAATQPLNAPQTTPSEIAFAATSLAATDAPIGDVQPILAPETLKAAPSDAPAVPVGAIQPDLAVLASVAALPTMAVSVPTDRPTAVTVAMPTETPSEVVSPSIEAVAVQPDAQAVGQADTSPQTATSVAPPQTRAKAALAFPGSENGPVDPVSLQAFQSFMEPDDPTGSAAEVRDGISNALSAVPCSRVQARFDPDVNALILTGHVPEDALRGTVLSVMQQQMGADIAVQEDLLILPRPQCGALAGISTVGLPQSTDQITNPLLVGDDTHAVEFKYVDGQPLVLDLQGADYDAFVYVDYFDADGNVLHLVPNEFTPLTKTTAKAALRIGSDRALSPGEPGLFIKIGPPYGQEIAVAFASSVPLYDGIRALIEPADAYLDWLREQVRIARDTHADFKGEWVYFFVSTSAQ